MGDKANYRSGNDAAGRIAPPRIEVHPGSAADPASGAEIARDVLRQGRAHPDDHRRSLAEILRRRREAQQQAGIERRTSAGEELRVRGGVHVDLEALRREADERGLSAALGGSDDGLELGEEQTRDDPVHATSGEFWHRGVDLELPGVGLAFRLERTYRSRTHDSGPLGPGWTHTYDQRLFFEPSPCGAGAVHWWAGTGDIVRFERSFPSGYSSAPASPHELTESTEGRFLIRAPGRRRLEFERPYEDAPFAVLRRVHAFGRLSRLELPHLTRTLRYDGFGALSEEYREREDGVPELFLRWNKNRVDEPVTAEDASGVLATYGYDGLGRVTSEDLSRGTRTTWDYYPGTDLVRSTTRPDGVTESLEYDAFGGVRELRVSREERTEASLHFERDPTGLRLATRTGAVGAGAPGRRRASTPTTVNHFAWTSTGELAREEVQIDGTTFLTTRRKEVTDGGALETLAMAGRTFARRRDALGRLTELTLDARPIVTYTYAGAGEVDQVRYGNGLVETHRTDALGRLTGHDTRAGTRAVLGFDAHLDARGLLARLDTYDELCGTRASLYRADAFGRLTESAMGIEGLGPWTSAGAVAEQLEQHGAVRRRYDASDRLTRLEVPGDVDLRPVAAADHTPLDFGGPVASDEVGRVTGFEDGTQYRYGALGELIEATLPSSEIFTFSYDALGRLAAARGRMARRTLCGISARSSSPSPEPKSSSSSTDGTSLPSRSRPRARPSGSTLASASPRAFRTESPHVGSV